MAALGWLLNLGFAGSASADTEPPTAQPVYVQVATARATNGLFFSGGPNSLEPAASKNSVTTE